mgnify:CR=1 FL=1
MMRGLCADAVRADDASRGAMPPQLPTGGCATRTETLHDMANPRRHRSAFRLRNHDVRGGPLN